VVKKDQRENQTILNNMKYIKYFEDISNDEVTCENCSWNWDIESDDDRKYLCHKCGFDDKLKDFDLPALEKWKSEYQK